MTGYVRYCQQCDDSQSYGLVRHTMREALVDVRCHMTAYGDDHQSRVVTLDNC